jgi:hypothetical protein
MLRNNTSTVQNCSYDDFDRLLDEIIRAEEDFTKEIRLFEQRLSSTEARIHKTVAELMQIIDERSLNCKVI